MNEYAVFYYSARMVNEKILGKLDESADTLKEAFSSKDIAKSEINTLYLLINQADQYFYQNLYSRAFETFNKIFENPKFNKLDEDVRFYLHIFEMINSFEAHNYGYTETRYKSFKKKFKALLKDSNYAKAERFVDILLRMNTAALEGKKVFLKSAHKNFVNDFGQSEIADNQIIMYEVYLRAKLDDKAYFEAFQEAVKELS